MEEPTIDYIIGGLTPEKKEIIDFINLGISGKNLQIIKNHKLYPNFLEYPEVREIAINLLRETFKHGNSQSNYDLALQILDIFQINSTERDSEFISEFVKYNRFSDNKLKEILQPSKSILKSDEFHELFVSKLSEMIESHHGADESVNNLIDIYEFPRDIINTDEIKLLIKDKLVKRIININADKDFSSSWYNTGEYSIKDLSEDFIKKYLPKDFLKNPEILDVAKEHIPVLADLNIVNKYNALFGFTEADTVLCAEKILPRIIAEGRLESWMRYKDDTRELNRIKKIINENKISEEIKQKEFSSLVERMSTIAFSNEKKTSSYNQPSDYQLFFEFINSYDFLKQYLEIPSVKKIEKDFFLHRFFSKNYRESETVRDIFKKAGIQKISFSEVLEFLNTTEGEILTSLKNKIRDIRELGSFFLDCEMIDYPDNLIEVIVDQVCKNELNPQEIVNIRGYERDRVSTNLKNIIDKLKTINNKFNFNESLIQKYTDHLLSVLILNKGSVNDETLDSILEIIDGSVGISPGVLSKYGLNKLNYELENQFEAILYRNSDYEYDDDATTWDSDNWDYVKKELQKIIDKYGINENDIKIALFGMYNKLIDYDNIVAKKLLEIFQNTSNELTSEELIHTAFLNYLKDEDGKVNKISAYAKSISSEFLRTEQVQVLGEELFLKLLSNDQIDEARNLKKSLSLGITVENITNLNPSAKKFIDVLREKFPILANKYLDSVDSFMSIYSQIGSTQIFSSLERYPFLGDALINNEQHGIKLLIKFASLDKLSKNNIYTLFSDKKLILKEQPSIDVNSRDFRIAIQNKLGGYRRNQEIITAMSKSGIDTETWLNYEEEVYFDLGKQEGKLSNQIEPAINRMIESVDNFVVSHKEVIGDYKKELTEHKILTVDIDKLRKNLNSLQESLELTKQAEKTPENIAKIASIEKVIANLENQINNPKMVSAWSHFIGDIERLSILKKDILSGLEALKVEEQKVGEIEISNLGPKEKRKEIQSIKDKIEKKKVDILTKADKFTLQIDSFTTKQRTYLEDILGKDRASSLVQEISEKIAEPLDHYTTDIGTLRDTLKEKDEEELKDTTLRIGVWDRNPDVDLYMGNYTNCCIRIDSEHMGEESTIADYITDLGMQVVSVYDEKKKIPIVAAWCWVGIDDDDKISFVVDNIEANTEYSTKHRDQITKELELYIKSYAHSIGIEKLTQGQSNNDLVIAGMDSAYFKIGGYNRASGYYLEGEDNHRNDNDDEHEPEDWYDNEPNEPDMEEVERDAEEYMTAEQALESQMREVEEMMTPEQRRSSDNRENEFIEDTKLEEQEELEERLVAAGNKRIGGNK